MEVFWVVVVGVLALLLTAAWVMDRRTARRGGRLRHSADTSFDVRESRRDVTAASPYARDLSWTSWSRRTRDGR